MKILSNTISSGSGSSGGTTLTRSRGGLALRSRRVPSNTSTALQQVIRNNMSSAAATWQNLSAAVQAAWTTFAQANPITDVLGQKQTLSGFNMYARTYTYFLAAKMAPGAGNPQSPGFAIPAPQWSATPTIPAGVITGSILPPVTPGVWGATTDSVLVYSSRPQSPGKVAAHQPMRLAGVLHPSAASSTPITVALADVWPKRGTGSQVTLQLVYLPSVSGVMYATRYQSITILQG
jgi:hypothetical protein